MGGNSNSTVQPNANPLASLFANSQGYQQAPVAPQPQIQQPSYPMPALTPQQAALATQQRMQLRTPLAPPVIAQKRPVQMGNGGGNGGGARGASSGGNGNGWGGH